MVAYHKHPKFSAAAPLPHSGVWLLANLACMLTYLVGPFLGIGTKAEPLLALGIALVWAIYGGIYFVTSSRSHWEVHSGKQPRMQRSRARNCINQLQTGPLPVCILFPEADIVQA